MKKQHVTTQMRSLPTLGNHKDVDEPDNPRGTGSMYSSLPDTKGGVQLCLDKMRVKNTCQVHHHRPLVDGNLTYKLSLRRPMIKSTYLKGRVKCCRSAQDA